MKTMLINLVLFSFIVFSPTIFANKMLIKGKPVLLKTNGNFYSFPKTYQPNYNYHFVNVGGVDRVCFLNKRPELASLDRLPIYIDIDGKKLYWNCYAFDKRFFEKDF